MSKILVDFSTLNTFDYVILGLLGVSILMGFLRGFLKEVISLITWFAALIVSLHFAPILSQHFGSFLPNEKTRYLSSIVLLFVVVLMIGIVINFFAGKLVTTSGLSPFDRILGVFFGAARGLLFVVILLLIIDASPFANATWAKSSSLSQTLSPIVNYFQVMMPKKMTLVVNWVQNAMSGNQ